jgi:archaellin
MATFNYSIAISRVKETPTRNVTFRMKVGGITLHDNQTAGTSGVTTLTGTVELSAGTTPLEIQVYNDESNRASSWWEGEGIKLDDITFKQGSAITDDEKSALVEYAKWDPAEEGQGDIVVSNISYAGNGSFLMDIIWDGVSSLAVISPQA